MLKQCRSKDRDTFRNFLDCSLCLVEDYDDFAIVVVFCGFLEALNNTNSVPGVASALEDVRNGR